jgi:hypothetical protein
VICTNNGLQSLPTLSFTFGGREFVLQPSDYMLVFDTGLRLAMMNIGPSYVTDLAQQQLFLSVLAEWVLFRYWCVILCRPSTQFDRFIMGDTFLKTYYTIFDGMILLYGIGSCVLDVDWLCAIV